MNIYIGYKYRNFTDKERLKTLLQKISDGLSSLGHKTFILGRDEFEWAHHKRPSKSILPIIKNMRKNDVLFAVIECESKSNGLFIESLFATILRKKVIIAVKNGINPRPFSYFSKDIIEFENYDDLLVSVKNYFESL